MNIIKIWKKRERKDWENNLDESKLTLYRIIVGIVICSFLELVIGLFIVNNNLKFIVGMILGTIVAILLVNNMYKSINKAIDAGEENADKVMRNGAILRIIAIFTIFFLAVYLRKYINIYGMFISTLNLKFSAYIMPLTNKLISF